MFSKYEVYTTVQSVYCYKDSNVLKNKLNIRDKENLKKAEEEITSLKQYVLLESPIEGRFTQTHLKKIHRFLFEDIYPFAGRIRREQISKGETMFYPPNLIDQELKKVFSRFHKENMIHEKNDRLQIEHLSYIMSELNIIHPFREGNGRSIRELIRCMAIQYGFSLDWSCVDRDTMLDASVRSVVDNTAFIDIIEHCKTDM